MKVKSLHTNFKQRQIFFCKKNRHTLLINRVRLGLLAICLTLLAAPAFATVFEIDPEGNVTKIEGAERRQYPTLARQTGQLVSRDISINRIPMSTQRAEISQAIQSAARSQQLDSYLIEAVGWQESRLRPQALSPKGAVGIMQLMPSTALALGVRSDTIHDNIRGGATYLRQMLGRYDGDLVLALAAYNAGPGAVDRYGGAPPYLETQAYIAAVLEHLAQQVVPIQSPSPSRRHP